MGAPDGAAASGQVQGNIANLHNVRNFDWQTSAKATARWEDRQYNLNQLVSVDMATSYWMGPAMPTPWSALALTTASASTDVLIEIRKEAHEQFSAIGGLRKPELGSGRRRALTARRAAMYAAKTYPCTASRCRKRYGTALFAAYVDKATLWSRRRSSTT